MLKLLLLLSCAITLHSCTSSTEDDTAPIIEPQTEFISISSADEALDSNFAYSDVGVSASRSFIITPEVEGLTITEIRLRGTLNYNDFEIIPGEGNLEFSIYPAKTNMDFATRQAIVDIYYDGSFDSFNISQAGIEPVDLGTLKYSIVSGSEETFLTFPNLTFEVSPTKGATTSFYITTEEKMIEKNKVSIRSVNGIDDYEANYFDVTSAPNNNQTRFAINVTALQSVKESAVLTSFVVHIENGANSVTSDPITIHQRP